MNDSTPDETKAALEAPERLYVSKIKGIWMGSPFKTEDDDFLYILTTPQAVTGQGEKAEEVNIDSVSYKAGYDDGHEEGLLEGRGEIEGFHKDLWGCIYKFLEKRGYCEQGEEYTAQDILDSLVEHENELVKKAALLQQQPEGEVDALKVDRDIFEEAAALFNRVDGKLNLQQQHALFEAHDFVLRNFDRLTATRPQQPAQEWIKTSDRLPEKPGQKSYEYVDCLIFHKGEIKQRPWNCEHLCWDDEHYDDHYCDPLEPTHWQPLPAAPKAGLKEG